VGFIPPAQLARGGTVRGNEDAAELLLSTHAIQSGAVDLAAMKVEPNQGLLLRIA
jgi:hypothetical protein